jgi:hypothetical protein
MEKCTPQSDIQHPKVSQMQSSYKRHFPEEEQPTQGYYILNLISIDKSLEIGLKLASTPDYIKPNVERRGRMIRMSDSQF